MILLHHDAGARSETPPPVPTDTEADLLIFVGQKDVLRAYRHLEMGGLPQERIGFVEYVGDDPSAFHVLADATRLFRHHLSEHVAEIRYLHYQTGSSWRDRGPGLPDEGPVIWDRGLTDTVQNFRLSPLVASSPLLPWLAGELQKAPIDDDRRFAMLATAFAGH